MILDKPYQPILRNIFGLREIFVKTKYLQKSTNNNTFILDVYASSEPYSKVCVVLQGQSWIVLKTRAEKLDAHEMIQQIHQRMLSQFARSFFIKVHV